MFRKLFVAAALALTVVAIAAPAQARPFTAKDMAMLDRLSDVHISPDGRWIAWSQRSTDWDGNKGVNALMLLDRKAPGAKPMTVVRDEKAPVAPRWSSDGQLYFLSSRDGTRQLYRVSPTGPAVTQVTKLPLDIGVFKLSGDGRTVILSIGGYPDCVDLACTKDRDEARKKDKASGEVFNQPTPRFWDSWADGKHSLLFAAALDPSGDTPITKPTPLMKGYDADVPGDDAIAVSADGKTVWFSAIPSGASAGVGAPSSVYVVAASGAAPPTRLYATAANASDGSLALSPDGGRLAFVRQTGPNFIYTRGAVMVRDLKTGAERELDVGFDRSVDGLKWSADGRTLYGLAEDTGQAKLFAIDAAKGSVTPLTTDGHVSEFDIAGGQIAYVRDALDSPGQLFVMGAKGPAVQLSHMGGDLKDVAFQPGEQFSFPGWNGETVHGYVVKPDGWQPGKKYPVAFLIHGGPHGSFGNAWSYRWNPQVWAGLGYAVVMVDFHGSSGYGEGYARAIIGHWGDRPLEDLQKGWAFALGKYQWLDGDEACALGGSYGGYMVNWIAGNWSKPWKCLVNHDGVFDTRSMAYSTDIPGFSEAQDDGLTWSNAAAVDRFNPSLFVDKWSVPMLVVHGGRDYRVPLDQGVGAYVANKRKEVPARMVYFPDENHWVLKPQNSVQWYANVEAWMKQWLGQ
ncbi:MAG: peptidase [Caulobacter sp.]|nr:peptidase [Caulobacter sp.]